MIHQRLEWRHFGEGIIPAPHASYAHIRAMGSRLVKPSIKLLVLLLLVGPSVLHAAHERPNILLIMGDNWSWPHASILGDKLCQTPTFDQLARDGVLFQNAFAPHPSCAPSRAAMLTGKVSHRLEEAASLWGIFPAKFAVFPDRLQEAGYAIGHTGKGWSPGSLKASGRDRNPAGPKFPSFDRFLDSVREDQPFFYWFSSRHPHRPWNTAHEHKTGMHPDDAVVPPHLPDHPTVRDDILNYSCEVIEFDRQASEIIQTLHQRERDDNTLIVITSDNGWQMPRGLANCYDSGTRIPLLLNWPGQIDQGLQSVAMVSLTDLAATFLEAAGLPIPQDMDSRSLLPLARGESQPHRDAMFVERERHANVRRGDLSYPVRGVRTNDFLYLWNIHPERWPAGDPEHYWSVGEFGDVDYTPTKRLLEDNAAHPDFKESYRLVFEKRPSEELYDLRVDPGQVHNVAEDPDYAETLKALRERTKVWMRRTGDPRSNGPTDFWDRAPYFGKKSRQSEE